jgi:hypothetical protein
MPGEILFALRGAVAALLMIDKRHLFDRLIIVSRRRHYEILMKGGGHMRAVASLFVIAFVLFTFVGMAVAKEKEMSGEVVAVDAAKGTLTLKSGTVESPFDCEEGSMIKDVKVGDHVTVKYKMEGGKKIATKVTPKKKKASGGY